LNIIGSSTADKASINIANMIIDLYDFKQTDDMFSGYHILSSKIDNKEVKLVTFGGSIVQDQKISDLYNVELLIFVSRHSSRSGIPTLTVHTPGNLGDASLGGKPRKLSISPANAMRNALIEMEYQKRRLKLDEFSVLYESTHHGPSLNVPTMFIEVGSSIKQWKNLVAAEAVAHSAIAAIRGSSNCEGVIGIGGPHYNEKFTHIALKQKVAFGHIIPKYAIPYIDEYIITQCVKRTVEEVHRAIFDWKGITGSHRRRIADICDQNGIEVIKTKKFKPKSDF
jgi:D-aminoacyl-tRNA deacylase